ncbi:MAG: Ig-like domain-containing protein, partial [Elusimicrobia bacterium]|nr:Ig-like domain-containing protein [Candidatus Obscuribacterium magneticum]
MDTFGNVNFVVCNIRVGSGGQNQPPNIDPQVVSVGYDGTASFNLSGADPESEPLVWNIYGDSSFLGNLSGTAPNELTYTSLSGNTLDDFLIAEAVDPQGNISRRVIKFEINPPPVQQTLYGPSGEVLTTANGDGATTFTFDPSGIAEGPQTFRAEARNTADQEAVTSAEFTVDNTPPTIGLVGRPPLCAHEAFRLSFLAQDNFGIQTVRVQWPDGREDDLDRDGSYWFIDVDPSYPSLLPQGPIQLVFLAIDSANLASTPLTIEFTVDNVERVSLDFQPSNTVSGVGTFVRGATDIILTKESDGGCLGTLRLYINNVLVSQQTNVSQLTYRWDTIVYAPEGRPTVRGVSVDGALNTGVVERVVEVDNTLPVVTLLSPTNGASLPDGIRESTAGANDRWLSGMQFLVNGSVVETRLKSVGVYELLNPVTAPGAYTVAVVARDHAGNSAQASANVTIPPPDTVPPVIDLVNSYPHEGDVLRGRVTFVAAVTDDRGVAEVRLRIDGSDRGRVTSLPYQFPIDTTVLSEGAHEARFIATDTSDNQTISNAIHLRVQNVVIDNPPTISLTLGAIVSGQPIAISITAGDDHGDPRVQVYKDADTVPFADVSAPPYDVTLTNPSEGNHSVYARAVDSAGQMTYTGTLFFVVPPPPDTMAPVIDLANSYPLDGAVLHGVATFVAVATDDRGVANVRLLIDGNPAGDLDTSVPYQFIVDTTGLTAGPHTAEFVATDSSGNSTTSAPVHFGVDNSVPNPDDPPTISLTLNPVVSGQPISFSITAADDRGHPRVEVYKDADSLPFASIDAPPYDATLDPTTLAYGNHSVYARATDNKGQTTYANPVSFDILPPPDTTGPVIDLVNSYPLDGAVLHGEVTFVAAATDDRGVAGVRLEIAGIDRGGVTSLPYQFPIDTTVLSEGAHEARFIANDTSGNQTVSDLIHFEVRNVVLPPDLYPTISLTLNPIVSGQPISFSITAGDDNGNPRVQVYKDADAVPFADVSAPSYDVTLNPATLSEGNHFVYARAVDSAGQMTYTDSVSFTLDRTPPIASIRVPADTVSGVVPVDVEAMDQGGVASYSISIDGTPVSQTAHCYWDTTTGIADGVHEITARVTDTSGNATDVVRNVVVDNIPTEIPPLDPGEISFIGDDWGSSGDAFLSGQDEFRVRLPDKMRGAVPLVQFRIDGSLVFDAAADAGKPDEFFRPLRNLALTEGPHSVEALVFVGGNPTPVESAPQYFTLDTMAPSNLRVTRPTDDERLDLFGNILI